MPNILRLTHWQFDLSGVAVSGPATLQTRHDQISRDDFNDCCAASVCKSLLQHGMRDYAPVSAELWSGGGIASVGRCQAQGSRMFWLHGSACGTAAQRVDSTSMTLDTAFRGFSRLGLTLQRPDAPLVHCCRLIVN